MHFRSTVPLLTACLSSCLAAGVKAQFFGGGGGDDGPPGFGGPGGPGGGWGYGPNGNGGSTTGPDGQSASASTVLSDSRHFLAAHGILAVVAWVLFVPTGAILLRLNIQSPIIIRLHATCQVLAYLIYGVAAFMGLSLARQYSRFAPIWSDPHPIMGVVILVAAFAQIWFGAIHHRIFKKQVQNANANRNAPKPARSSWSHLHIWLGRVLIVAAMVNGGLGLRLAGKSGAQSASTMQNIEIIYAVLAGWIFLLYAGISWSAELTKRTRERQERNHANQYALKDGLPSYTESEESIQQRRWA